MLYWPVLLLFMAVGYGTVLMVLWRSLVSTESAGSAYRVVMVMPAMLCLVLLAYAAFDYVVWPGEAGIPVEMNMGFWATFDRDHYHLDTHTIKGTMYPGDPGKMILDAPTWTESGCTTQNCKRIVWGEPVLTVRVNGTALHVDNPRYAIWDGTDWHYHRNASWTGDINREDQSFRLLTPANDLRFRPLALHGTIQAAPFLPGDAMYLGAWVGIHMGLAVLLFLFVFLEVLTIWIDSKERRRRGA